MSPADQEIPATTKGGRLFSHLHYFYLLLCVPLGWLAMRYDRYAIDGDAVSYMDIADQLHAHHWAGAVNGYWHPLYPSLLWLAQVLFHATRATELRAYYMVNFALLLFQMAAMFLFLRALVCLRTSMSPLITRVLPEGSLHLLGTALLLISVMRELSLGKVRTDSLLQGLILLGFAMLLRALAANRQAARVGFSGLMGLCFGLAYLTKSFALVLALLSVAVLLVESIVVRKRPWLQSATAAVVALAGLLLLAGPYIAVLSQQKHRLTFGESGSLNYVWYVSGTEKMHLEPWMTGSFGSATVHLQHPETQLLTQPGVYSYKAFPYGTYPPWFDATYFNERITPRFNLRLLLQRDARNAVLMVRYLVNHPEPLILLALLLFTGAKLRHSLSFAWPVVLLGCAMWVIYAMVNVEERYVTVAFFAVLLPLFAALSIGEKNGASTVLLTRVASVIVLTFALLTMGELLRQDAANRRDELVSGPRPAWRSPAIYGAAEALAGMGLQPGDAVACMGTRACIDDTYWARVAGVRILTEVYEPVPEHLIDRLDTMPNRQKVYDTVRQDGARVLVAVFDPGEMNGAHPAAVGWTRLGETSFYALPMKPR